MPIDWALCRTMPLRQKLYVTFGALFLVCLVVAIVVPSVLLTQSMRKNIELCNTEGCVHASHFILSMANLSADPCQDFQKFACGKFVADAIVKNHTMMLHHQQQEARQVLKGIIMGTKLEDQTNFTKSFRDLLKYYEQCSSNSSLSDEVKDKTVQKTIDRVTGGWPLYVLDTDKNLNWIDLTVRARTVGFPFNFFVSCQPKSISLDYAHFYVSLQPVPESKFINIYNKEKNKELVLQMAQYWGGATDIPLAQKQLNKTFEFGNKLYDIIVKHQPNKTSIISVSKMYQIHRRYNEDWLALLNGISKMNLTQTSKIIYDTGLNEYLPKLQDLMDRTDPRAVKNHVYIQLLLHECVYLSPEIKTICKALRTLGTEQKKDIFCFEESLDLFRGFGEAEFMRRTLKRDKLEQGQLILSYMKKALTQNFEKDKQLTEDTRKSIIEHVNGFQASMGWWNGLFNATYFEEEFGISKEEFDWSNYMEIRYKVNSLLVDRMFFVVTKEAYEGHAYADIIPTAESEAFMDQLRNIILITGALLLDPVMAMNRPEYLNFATVGTIIGHEIMHGFEVRPDITIEHLMMENNPWSLQFLHIRQKIKKCLNESYIKYVEDKNLTVAKTNEKTMEEALGDLTAINLALQAYNLWADDHGVADVSVLPGLKLTYQQTFWTIAASFNCVVPDSDMAIHPELRPDQDWFPHPESSWRVNSPAMNSRIFAEIFECPVGSPMNPEQKCSTPYAS